MRCTKSGPIHRAIHRAPLEQRSMRSDLVKDVFGAEDGVRGRRALDFQDHYKKWERPGVCSVKSLVDSVKPIKLMVGQEA